MPFEIIVKPKGSSNKPTNLSHLANPSLSQQCLSQQGITPFIDRLSITLDVPTKQQGEDMWSAHWSEVNDTTLFTMGPWVKGYQKSYRLILPSLPNAKTWPQYQVRWDGKCITKLRIDFVPADLGPEGMFELHILLVNVMNSGWGFIAKHGKVTRLDVALDFPSLSMGDVHFLPLRGVTSRQWNQGGYLTGYRLGSTKGSYTMIYDRGEKRKAKGQASVEKTGVRIERRLLNAGLKVQQLPTLAWPFAGLRLVPKINSAPPGEGKPYLWQMFLAAVEQRGMAAALAILPPKKRTVYRKHLKAAALPLLCEEVIWPNWTSMLDELKLADPVFWH